MIYLDNSATTKPDEAVLQSFDQVTKQFYANPSSIHQFGGTTEKLLHAAKQQAAEILQVERMKLSSSPYLPEGRKGIIQQSKELLLNTRGEGNILLLR